MLHILRSHNSLIVECKILTGMVKMLKSNAVEVVKDPKSEKKVNDRPGPEVVIELVSLQEKVPHDLRKL